jgi:hypothetical protein
MSHRALLRTALVVTCLGTVAFTKSTYGVRPPLTPPTVASVWSLSCDLCSDTGMAGLYQHTFSLGSGAMFDCQVFNACHDNYQSGICGAWHCPCQAISCPPPEAAAVTSANKTEGALSVDVVANAARRDDARELSGILHRNGDVVRFNATRGVVQFLGCGQQVIAQFPVSAAIAVALD